jgi:hypothetical protein
MKRVVGGLVVRRRKSASSARRRAWKKEKPTRVPFDRDRRALDAIAVRSPVHERVRASLRFAA